MTKAFRRALVSASALLLTGVLMLATSPVQASSVDQRIDTLEQELTRLKQEQAETRNQALAAEKKIPLFIFRPGNGLTIAAANDKWEIQFGNRLMVYWTFWTKGGDGTSIPSKGTTNGVLQVRRFRPYMMTRINDGFYDLRFRMNTDSSGDLTAFDGEMYIHFENISPWLPYFGFGFSPSTIMNPQDINLSSTRGGRSEQSVGVNGVRVGTGGTDRGMGIVWNKLPRFGPVRIKALNFWLHQDEASEYASASGADITADGRTFTGGIVVAPFDKMGGSFGKVMKGLDLSFGTRILQAWSEDGILAWNFRTDQTRSERVSMIRTTSHTGIQYFFSPGVGWKWNWMQLRISGLFSNVPECVGSPCSDGGQVRASQFRIMGEFFLWSPKKGLLAGNPRDGGLMISPLYNRVNVWGQGLTGSTPSGKSSNGQAATATNTGIALWYYIPGRFMNVGVVWDHWACTNCNSDVSSVVRDFNPGGSATWDTITLISRFQF